MIQRDAPDGNGYLSYDEEYKPPPDPEGRPCQQAPEYAAHTAELAPDGETYVYLAHDDAVKWSCRDHSGLCHAGCWEHPGYAGLLKRVHPDRGGTAAA